MKITLDVSTMGNWGFKQFQDFHKTFVLRLDVRKIHCRAIHVRHLQHFTHDKHC
jgi:hypothetical protein